MTRDSDSRDRLIALNSGESLARDSICKLARHLDELVNSGESATVLGQRLGVPTTDLTEAKRLTAAAHDLADLQLELAEKQAAEIVTLLDPGYPQALHDLELPPPVLYCQGRIPAAPAIGIVGSRQATPQGIDVAELFGRELAMWGLTVVSGFARGIDLAAHRGALSSLDGRTVAVLGCGLDVDYPSGRRHTRKTIPIHGALVSEFPFGAQPRTWNFPIRNRIIAALSLGILVVQGTPRSGSLITARLALDLGRDVYAIPGSILDRRSAGPNALIQDGALLANRPEDVVESLPAAVLESLRHSISQSGGRQVTGPLGELLQDLPPGQRVTAEQLSSSTGRPLDQILGILLELEMMGLVKRFPGPVFSRKL